MKLTMMYLLRNKKGQLAPFFIILIAVLIMALMVTANIGKIGLHRVNTSNASDSGALAGGTMMANGLTAIMNISTMMFRIWIEAQIVLGSCMINCGHIEAVYMLYLWTQYMWYQTALDTGEKACDDGEDAARQLGFTNAEIDEPKPRITEESWEDWRKRKSRFGLWMEDKEYKQDDTYTWLDDGSGECNTADANCNWVRVDAHAPSGFRLTLQWVPIVLRGRVHHGCCTEVEPFIAFISNAPNDNAPIRVTVTRREPSKDLGLWRMVYGNIVSRSWAQAYDGNVRPRPLGGRPYDSRLARTE